ncbi:MAG: amidohydrolase family protein [Elusimicrobiota bacterium]|nr:amidohydrolase family protein [Elusimicrobiota bacterium]
MFDIFIKNGLVVNSDSAQKTNIGIKNGAVSYMGTSVRHASSVIDAAGKFVFPGVIDPHVHFMLEAYGAKTCDDYYTASHEAAAGGVTAFIDFAIPASRNSSLKAEVSRRVKQASASCVDFSFHPQILGWTDKIKEDAAYLISKGFPTFKIFMPPTEGWGVTDNEIYEAVRHISSLGGAVGFHAEDGKILENNLSRLVKRGRTAPRYFALSGSSRAESEAVLRVSSIAKKAKGRIYICHVSSRAGIEALVKSRRGGVDIKAESCPHYIFLNDAVFEQKNNYLFCCNPVLKKKSDNSALLKALKKDIDWIGTDHCAFSKADKERNKKDFRKIPRGLPGVGMSFPLLFTASLRDKKSLMALARLTSESAAENFGLKKKGAILPGMDADIFVTDPERSRLIRKSAPYGWSPYEGRKLSGFSDITIRRGEIIYKNGRLCAERASGRLIFRKLV